MSLLDETVAAIAAPDEAARAAARERLDRMTMPRGALGRVGELGVTLAGIAGACPPPVPEPAAVAVFAGDHGVHAQGVTPWPQEVTAQMVANFLAGGAVVNAFARQIGADVIVVDVGVAAPLDPQPGLVARRVADGTADMTTGPALTREQARAAVEVGIDVARDLAGRRAPRAADRRHGHRQHHRGGRSDLRLHRSRPGRRDGPRHRHRRRHPRPQDRRRAARGGAAPARPGRSAGRARRVRRPGARGAGRVRARRGGGAGAGAARRRQRRARRRWRRPRSRRTPSARASRVTARRSPHIGSRSTHLGLDPLIDLEMRLGEGTGALLALPVAQGAARALRDVATFDAAGVTDKEG